MNEGLAITGLGMGVVFFVLVVISLMIFGMGKVFGTKKVTPTPVVSPKTVTPTVNHAVNDQEVVAAIMAAVTAYMGTSQFRINAITPLVVRPMVRAGDSSPWTAAGISENNHR